MNGLDSRLTKQAAKEHNRLQLCREAPVPHEHFKVFIDEAMGLITFRLKGAEPSAFYAEKFIRAYAEIDKPWLYNRLLDYRQFTGIIEGPDVERLAQNWAHIVQGQTYTARIAVLTGDALTPVRASHFNHLFPNEEIRVFDHLHSALDWLAAKP